MSDLLTTAQVARLLGRSRQRIGQLIDAGQLPAVRLGRRWMVERAALAKPLLRPVGRPRLTPRPEPVLEPEGPRPSFRPSPFA